MKGSGTGLLLQQARLDQMIRRGIENVRTEADLPATIRRYVERFGHAVPEPG